MLLFTISFLLIFISSYFLTSVISSQKGVLVFIYTSLIAFAQIVLTFEILSLFTAIGQGSVLIVNFLFFIICFYLWNKHQRPLCRLDFTELKKIYNSLKLDKSLIYLSIGFCIFLFVSLILCVLMPVNNADALSYHLARSLFWVLQGNLNHFEVSDIRNLCLPINSEILYAWILLFIKKDVFIHFFSFVGYLLSIVSIYNILGFLGYCVRKKLWVIFILTSLPSVLIQASSSETDIIIAGLISSSIFLFWYSIKNNKLSPLYMSSLAYALAIGTKTTAIIAIPGISLFFLGLCFYYKKYREFGLFLAFGIINFLVFSSYNYILNYLHFLNFMGAPGYISVVRNFYGMKGAFANLIKHLFLFFDFTGFRWSDYLNPYLTLYKSSILNFFGLGNIQDCLYSISNKKNLLIEPFTGPGVLGFLVYIPCILISIFKKKSRHKSKKTSILAAFGWIFLINLFVLSYIVSYSIFDSRYIVSFLVISSPVLVYSYFSKRNPLKYVVILFSLFSMLVISTNIWGRPIFKIVNILAAHKSISYLRYIATCKSFGTNPQYSDLVCLMRDEIIKKFKPNNNIAVFLSSADNIYLLKTLEFYGYKIDFKNMEDVLNIDFNKYNLVILENEYQNSTYVKKYGVNRREYTMNANEFYSYNNSKVRCYYLNAYGKLNFKENYPYCVVCKINNDFLLEKNLELFSGTELISSYTNQPPNYFLIYRNKNLELKLKNKN